MFKPNRTNFSVRKDSGIKKQCEARQPLRAGVALNTPNATTIAAMKEAENLAKIPMRNDTVT